MNSVAQVIKVVNLKRFMPETVLETRPKLKRPCCSVTNLGSSQKNEIGIETCSKEYTIGNGEKCVISEIENTPHNDDQALARRSKIQFRYCSHSPEELSTLHEHVDETLVKLGDTFDSRESLRQHLNENARKWHYYYVCRNSKKKLVEYNCICMAYNNKQRDMVIRKQKKRTTACPCKLRLSVDVVTKKMIVYFVCNHHDHPTTANTFSQYPHAKYLPHHVKEDFVNPSSPNLFSPELSKDCAKFLDLTFLGLDVTLIQKYIFSVIGLKIKKKDIWSYTYRYKRKIFQRTFDETRREVLEDLIKKIRETFGEPTDHELTVLEPRNNTVISSTPNNDIAINPSESSFYKETFSDHSLGLETEVIVQYINEDGLLCDENGVLVTSNTDTTQFIGDNDVVESDAYEDTRINRTVEAAGNTRIHKDTYCFDWKSIQSKSMSSDVIYINVSNESRAANDEIDELSTRMCPEQNYTVTGHCVYENRLLPTTDTPAFYAEMENFNKYYYIDHRYIRYEDQNEKKPSAVRTNCKLNESAPVHPIAGVNDEGYVKAPNFVHWPPSFRRCSGHDHLDLLTDPEAILPGAKFRTLEAFLNYVNKRANRWFFYYSLAESGKSPENYAYKCVYGKHRVSKNAYRAKGLRKRSNQKTDCPCLVRLRRLDSAPDYLTVLYSCNHHDHPRDERQFNTQVHSRRLPPHMKEEIKDLVMLRISSDVLRKYLLDETGLLISGKYFYNLWAGMRRRKEERHFSEERVVFLKEKVRDLGARYGNDQARNIKAPSQDTLPSENSTKQSRLEKRLQNLSHKDILTKVRKLQESVRCEGLRNHEVISLRGNQCNPREG